MRKANLEHDLIKSDYIADKCGSSDSYSQNLYAAMCNNLFYKDDEEWSCSWRYAGGVLADIRDVGESYIDWYCSGIGSSHDGYVGESFVTDEIRSDLLQLGWTIKEYPSTDNLTNEIEDGKLELDTKSSTTKENQ